MSNTSEYVAALPTDRIGDALVEQLDSYTLGSKTTRPMLLWTRQQIAYNYLYGMGDGWLGPNTSSVSRGGSEGELAIIRVNHARNYLEAQVATLTAPKFIWQPQPAGNDYASIIAAQKSRQVLDHYYFNGPLANLRIQAWESACSLGEGFTLTEIDDRAGDTIIPTENGDVIAAGDLKFWNILPWDVIRNPYKRSWRELDWKIVRTRRNRWEVAARYPDHKDEIMNAPTTSALWPIWVTGNAATGTSEWDKEDVDVLHFYADPSAMLPKGRETCFLYDGTVLSDGPLRFGVVPLVRRSYAEAIGTPFGYAQFFEITGIQQAYDSVQSSILSCLSAFGTQYLGVKKGTDPRPLLLGGGLGVFEAEDRGDVWPIQLTAIPGDAYKMLAEYERIMGLLMNTPSVVMGQPAGDRQSGSQFAAAFAAATQKTGPSQSNDVDALKDQGRIILRAFREMAKGKKVRIGLYNADPSSPTRETEMSAEDIGLTERVYIDLGNPAAQTTEGQLLLLEKLAQLNIPVTPEQVKTVLTTGRFDPVTGQASAQNALIQLENEMISKGQAPTAKLVDDHLLHVQRHIEVTSNPAVRNDQAVMKAFEDHINEHYSLFWNVPLGPPPPPQIDPATGAMIPPPITVQTDPAYHDRMLILTGQKPPAAMVPPPMAGEGPSPTQPPAPGASSPTEPPGNPNAGRLPSMPKPPTNPLTRRSFNPVNGGGTPPSPNAQGVS